MNGPVGTSSSPLTQRQLRWQQSLGQPNIDAVTPQAPVNFVSRPKKMIKLIGGGSRTTQVLSAMAMTFLFTLLLLLFVAPPMVRRKPRSEYDAARRVSPIALIVWALVPSVGAALFASLC